MSVCPLETEDRSCAHLDETWGMISQPPLHVHDALSSGTIDCDGLFDTCPTLSGAADYFLPAKGRKGTVGVKEGEAPDASYAIVESRNAGERA